MTVQEKWTTPSYPWSEVPSSARENVLYELRVDAILTSWTCSWAVNAKGRLVYDDDGAISCNIHAYVVIRRPRCLGWAFLNRWARRRRRQMMVKASKGKANMDVRIGATTASTDTAQTGRDEKRYSCLFTNNLHPTTFFKNIDCFQ